MDGGLLNKESRPFGFSSMSRNGFDVSGSSSSRWRRNALSSSPCNGPRTRPTRFGPCFSSSGISVRAARPARSKITKLNSMTFGCFSSLLIQIFRGDQQSLRSKAGVSLRTFAERLLHFMRNFETHYRFVSGDPGSDHRRPESGTGGNAHPFCDRLDAARHSVVYHRRCRIRPWSPSHTVLKHKAESDPLKARAVCS